MSDQLFEGRSRDCLFLVSLEILSSGKDHV